MTTKNFVSWSLNSEEIFDDEGDVVGEVEYALIDKLFVSIEDRGQGKGRALIEGAIKDIKAAHPSLDIKIAALPFGEDAIDMSDLV